MPLEAFRGRAVQMKSRVISNRPLQEAYLIGLIMHQCDGENSTKTELTPGCSKLKGTINLHYEFNNSQNETQSSSILVFSDYF